MTTEELKRAVFYGPHPCEVCGKRIAKAARANGGAAFDFPDEGPYPNTEWRLHECSGVEKSSLAPLPEALEAVEQEMRQFVVHGHNPDEILTRILKWADILQAIREGR